MTSETNSKISKEEKEVIKSFMKGASLLGYLAFATLGVIIYLFLNNRIPDLSGGVKAKDLKDFSTKLEFLFRFQAVNVAWLLSSMYYVVSKRLGTGAVNPMAGYEHHVLAASKHFNNTVEQFILSLTSQIVLLTFLESDAIIKIIPLLNVLFFVGRVTFWLGYPTKRSFGFTVSHLPIAATILYCLYRFIRIYYV